MPASCQWLPGAFPGLQAISMARSRFLGPPAACCSAAAAPGACRGARAATKPDLKRNTESCERAPAFLRPSPPPGHALPPAVGAPAVAPPPPSLQQALECSLKFCLKRPTPSLPQPSNWQPCINPAAETVLRS